MRTTVLGIAAVLVGTIWQLTGAAAAPSVRVLPVFFVPVDEVMPTNSQITALMRHLTWTQQRYREMLGGRATFEIAGTQPIVYRAREASAFYRAQPEGAAPNYVEELLAYTKHDRYSCPFVFLVLYVSPSQDFPTGGGRPLNGGYNTGGGVVILSSYALDRAENFQSTLEHEIGHSFGLPHVDVYGYSMDNCKSIMSYNRRHWTKGFRPSATPGVLIPEDLRGLALNQRVFPGLQFSRADLPAGYRMAGLVNLGPMSIPERTSQRNLALNRPARQSSLSEYSRLNDAAGGVDGVKNGSFGFHTNREDHPWWQVDLGSRCTIREVRIFNRLDYNPERAATLVLRLSDNGVNWKTVYQHDGTNPGGGSHPLRVRVASETGRYVRVELRARREYLHLDEVEVYGSLR